MTQTELKSDVITSGINFMRSITGCLGSDWKARKISEWEIVEVELTEKEVKGIHEIIKPEKLVELITK